MNRHKKWRNRRGIEYNGSRRKYLIKDEEELTKKLMQEIFHLKHWMKSKEIAKRMSLQ